MRSAYAQLLTDSSSSLRTLLVAIEKYFFKIESYFKKCRQFCKRLYAASQSSNQQDDEASAANVAASSFALASPTLVYLLDDNVFALYSSVFFLAKKIQTMHALVQQSIHYHDSFLFSSTSTTSSSGHEMNIEAFFLPLK